MRVQQHAPAALYPRETPGTRLQEVGWAPGPVWTGGKSRPHLDFILTLLFALSYMSFIQSVKIVLFVQGVRYYWMLLSYVHSLPPESYGNWGGGCALLL